MIDIVWQSTPGAPYVVQTSLTMGANSWVNVANINGAAGSTTT